VTAAYVDENRVPYQIPKTSFSVSILRKDIRKERERKKRRGKIERIDKEREKMKKRDGVPFKWTPEVSATHAKERAKRANEP
jgi:hypothetical protein